MYVDECRYVCMWMNVGMYVCTYVWMNVGTYVCTYMYVCFVSPSIKHGSCSD